MSRSPLRARRHQRAGAERGRRRRWAVGGIVMAVPVALAGMIATNGSRESVYRTALAETADVDATLDAPGTIQPVNQANLSFPIGGTIRSVSATVGQHVGVGQTLAELDTTSLDAQLASAQSATAAAAARLAADQSSQTVTTPVAPTAFSAEITANSPDPASAARERVSQLQARLLADQHQADQDITREKSDVTTERGLCQAFADVTRTGTSHSAKSASVSPSPDPDKCQSAIAAVLADQAAVDHDQRAVAADLPTLSTAIDTFMTTAQAIRETQPSPTPEPSQAPKPTPAATPASTPRPTPAPTSRPQARATAKPAPGITNRTTSVLRPVSAEQLAADQAAIDAAQAQLTEAQQAHDQAELRSPIDGTVGSVTLSAGQSVQGSPGTPQIVVIGPGAHQVTTLVSDVNVASVQVGAAATVIPSGSSTPVTGQVVSIGLLASSSSASPAGSTSYPITIGLTGANEQLFAGQSASVSIMLGHASGVLTVPSSAVHHLGARTTVSVLRNGTPSDVPVTLGAAGPARTQVLTGLNPGDQVILADLSRPLPAGDVQNVRRITGGGGAQPVR
ncbi:MAG TPA: HlyD family efflux transporter periplasmic adaptor subunit [Pseudonocardiaceae bacterium]|nr:HlyD family efflux transporter periplasmic adaptor subunit [Pseudonocardiaceae bacterium]